MKQFYFSVCSPISHVCCLLKFRNLGHFLREDEHIIEKEKGKLLLIFTSDEFFENLQLYPRESFNENLNNRYIVKKWSTNIVMYLENFHINI